MSDAGIGEYAATKGAEQAVASAGALASAGGGDIAAGLSATEAAMGASGAAGVAGSAVPAYTSAAADSALASSQLGLGAADVGAATAPAVDLGANAAAGVGESAAPDIATSGLQDMSAGGPGSTMPGTGVQAPADLTSTAGAGPSASSPSWLSTALGGAKTALPYASLATNLYAMQKAGSAAGALNKSAGTTGNVGSQLLAGFQSGQLSGADQQAIAQYGQQQTAAVNDYYAKAGLSNSSMHTQALQQVQQQAETMRQQALQNMLSQGLSATGTTNNALTAAANAGLAQSKDTSAAMQDFMKALSQMNAQPGATPTVTPTPGG